MGTPKEYDPEPLVEAVTDLDWSIDHARQAMKAIQETVLKNTGDHLSEVDALKVLGWLVECRFIRTRLYPPAGYFAETGRLEGKYFRVPDNER